MGKQRTSRPQAYKAPLLNAKKARKTVASDGSDSDSLVSESRFAEGELESLLDRHLSSVSEKLGRSSLISVHGNPSLKLS